MKKIFAATAALLITAGAHAQAIYEPGQHDNMVTVVADDAADEIDNYPLDITLDNPTTPMGSVSVYLYIDDNSIRPWVYDNDEECYAYDTNTKRCYKSVIVQIFECDDTNPTSPGYLFVNALDTKDFKLTTGTIITVYFDATKLSDGYHTIHVVEPMCSSASADGSESASYYCADQEITFHVGNGTITVVDGINAIYPPYPAVPTYDLQGRLCPDNQTNTAPCPGIYIRDGKKIIR